MLRVRVIPCLQLLEDSLVKTVQFKNPGYIGDFANTARIFNELEVDELCILGIRVTKNKTEPDWEILEQIANECFMPLSYGGGIKTFEQGKKVLTIGYEKVVLNSIAYEKPEVVTQLADHFGVQSVIGSIDIKKNVWGKYTVYSHGGTKKQKVDPVAWAKELVNKGAGELLITSMNNDGLWTGYDEKLIKSISDAVNVPVIANGGAGKVEHISSVVKEAGASATGLGSMVVYQNKGMGVLVNFPDIRHLDLNI